ncbi:hypothetical protein [Pseudomonas aeruginosa]|uniref:Uncharacterized protein n=1 Tax=Pseudomonas aeruginosa TaxID=287 RepID=A0A3M5DZ30_PSEAI|nr:hypothetical protein [Pseudomonas aeruginosa]EKW2906513.1 hypothetical protein [Pseudomonas aeruginosa]MBG6951324.1 hypothetical protein [Pseudomonas aeruginosa]MDI2216071.1 hypothetical protein [Pseudomonas aeruginosa]MXU53637.1 hypothetical protein [Pseudomonas aeruginosa]RMK28278.1 hypothetical protein IPC1258_07680 [Pseudomonas aeruginosa]
MALSLIRSLTASAARNISALKRDAKRLQKHSQLVFGTEYPLKVCQHAVAVSRGFRSLADVEHLEQRLGINKDAPFWTIRSRNDVHQGVLEALYSLDLEYTENGPIVFIGEQKHSALPALVLFLEQMSFKKRPGLILVETEALSIQDTAIFDAVKKLEIEETLDKFRSLDLRDRNLPVSLSTESRCWISAIIDVLPKDIQKEIRDKGLAHHLEISAYEHAKSRNQVFGSPDFPCIPFYSVKSAFYQLTTGSYSPPWMDDVSYGEMPKIDRQRQALEKESEKVVLPLIETLESRNFGVGVSCDHESQWRPYIVIFSRNDPASEVLAGVVRSYFSWKQDRDHRSPALYISDGETPYAPEFLTFGDHTAIVNGATEIPSGDGPGEFYGYKNSLKVIGTSDGIQFMGKRVPLG